MAADASALIPAIRACHRSAHAASHDQHLFALYLPVAEFTLQASVHGAAVSERAMPVLTEAMDLCVLRPGDRLLLDLANPAAWRVQVLIERGVPFVMRCNNASGWSAVRKFGRSGQTEAGVTLQRPSRAEATDAADLGCKLIAPTVRSAQLAAPDGAIQVLATKLRPTRSSCPNESGVAIAATRQGCAMLGRASPAARG